MTYPREAVIAFVERALANYETSMRPEIEGLGSVARTISTQQMEMLGLWREILHLVRRPDVLRETNSMLALTFALTMPTAEEQMSFMGDWAQGRYWLKYQEFVSGETL